MKDKISEGRVALLHPAIRDEVKDLIEKAEGLIDSNLAIRVVQGLRTFEEQNALYNQPFDKKDNDGDGKVDEADECVTKAKAGSSYHNYGLAIDFCFLWLNDKEQYVYDEERSWLTGKNHAKVVKVFKDAGYVWGGDFKSIVDKPHFEKSFGKGWRELQAKHLAGDFINGTRYVRL